MSPLLIFASSFWFFLVGVRDRFSCCSSLKSGFSLGIIRFGLVSASFMHSCGVQHSLFQSSVQSWHLQYIVCWWVDSCSGILNCADVRIRSAMVLIPCLWIRHFVALLLRVCCTESRWNQAGSWLLRCMLSLMVAKFTLYF